MRIDLGLYILNGRIPVPCTDFIEWNKWMKSNRRVALDTIDGVEVSTVFLGIDHGFFNKEPILFETMVFGGSLDGELERCSTWEQAEKMHSDMVAKLKRTKLKVVGKTE
jgi:hypothetical protein